MKYKDQTGRWVELINTPTRIVSVVPSQTELLYDLGLEENIAGITKFCIHPQKIFRTKTRVGGTKQLNIKKIKEINPHLVIANKEENTKDELEEIMKDFPVWISDVKTLDDAMVMISSIGEITGTQEKANAVNSQIKKHFNDLSQILPAATKTAAYLIWQKPYMAAGGDTFINNMIHRAGLNNIFTNQKRYPETTIEELNVLKPEIIILSSEPFPFKEKHRIELQQKCIRSNVILADGEMFSWYGSRLLKAPGYFTNFARQYIL